jgi:type IV secretory pathway TrbD component
MAMTIHTRLILTVIVVVTQDWLLASITVLISSLALAHTRTVVAHAVAKTLLRSIWLQWLR